MPTNSQQEDILTILRNAGTLGVTCNQAAIKMQRLGHHSCSEKNAGAKLATLCTLGFAKRAPTKRRPTGGSRLLTVYVATDKTGPVSQSSLPKAHKTEFSPPSDLLSRIDHAIEELSAIREEVAQRDTLINNLREVLK